MNTITGEIEAIKTHGSLSMVYIRAGKERLSAIVIDTPKTAGYLQVGHAIKAIFKETEVIIGKGTIQDISLQNRLEGKIEAVESGEILSKVTVATSVGKIHAIITTNAVVQLKLQIDSPVSAMIKTNEIMLAE